MRKHYSFAVSLPIRSAALIAGALTLIACGESTAPIISKPIPKKYVVTTSESTAAAGDTVIVKAQLVDASDHAVPALGRTVSWVVSGGTGLFTFGQSQTDDQGVATNYFVVGAKANVSDVIVVTDEEHLGGASAAITVVPAQP